MSWYLAVIKNKYADFTGRARRQEYWMYTLVNCIIIFALYFLVVALYDSTMFYVIYGLLALYSLATFVPTLAVSIRRLHDTERPGWFVIFAFIPLANIVMFVFMCIEGTKGTNKYGSDPKA